MRFLFVVLFVIALFAAPATRVPFCQDGNDLLIPPLAAPAFMAVGATLGVCE